MPLKGTKQLRAILVLVGVALATLAVGVAFGAGGGSVQGFASKIDIHYDKGHNLFNGHVDSHDPCKANRTVHVFKQNPNGADTMIGTTTTGKDGKWDSISPTGPGFYYATVDRSETTGYGNSLRCGGAESDSVEVPPNSKIDISYDHGHNVFKGHVDSDIKSCKASRTVNVFRQNPSPPDTLIGTTTTDSDGHWDTISPPGPGTYYAQVTQQGSCDAATSKTVDVKSH